MEFGYDNHFRIVIAVLWRRLRAKIWERTSFHATNIAEEVIFMVQGKDIRHGRKM